MQTNKSTPKKKSVRKTESESSLDGAACSLSGSALADKLRDLRERYRHLPAVSPPAPGSEEDVAFGGRVFVRPSPITSPGEVWVVVPPTVEATVFAASYPTIKLPVAFPVKIISYDGSFVIGRVLDTDLVLRLPNWWITELYQMSSDETSRCERDERPADSFLSLANVKVHTPLPARASDETGVKP
jgi:hypothetical protein